MTHIEFRAPVSGDDQPESWHNVNNRRRIERIRELSARIESDRAERLRLIRGVDYSEKGTLTEVTAATGWTRAHVANIRDGKAGRS
jgi:hypothetical protein